MLTSYANWTKWIGFHVNIAVLASKEAEVGENSGLR